METFLVYTFIGLTTAAIYAVIASGLVLTYTTTGVFNFAHGAIGMLAAFAYWQMHEAWHWPTLVAVLVDLLVLGPLLGLFLERVIMRGLGGTSEATKLVVSISLLVAMIGLANVLWNPDVGRTVYPFFNGKKIRLGPTALSYHQLITIIVAILVALGLRLLLTRSRLGVTMRAVVDDPALTQLNGAHPTRVAQFSWAIGCSLAALGGVLVVSSTVLNASGLALLIVNAYAAAIFGRLRSLPLTFVGAIILGLADGYLRGYLPQNDYLTALPLAAPAILLFIVLLAMPNRRLRTHVRTREYFPAPTVRGAALFCIVVLLGGLMMATTMSTIDLPTYSQLFAIGIIALSLVPLVGFAGQISLCQLSFAGIGAVCMAHAGINGNPLGFVVAIVVCGVVGALVALPALRLQGIYMALATAAFAVFLDQWVFHLPDFDVGPIHLGSTTVVPHIMHFSTFSLGSVNVSTVKLFGYNVITPTAQMILATVQPLRAAPPRHARQRGRVRHLRPRPARHPPVGVRHVGGDGGPGRSALRHPAHRGHARPLQLRRGPAHLHDGGGRRCRVRQRRPLRGRQPQRPPAVHDHRLQQLRQVPADPHRWRGHRPRARAQRRGAPDRHRLRRAA